MNTRNTFALQLFSASIVDALREAGLALAADLAFAVDPEEEDTLVSRSPLYGGTLVVRVAVAGEWDEAEEGAPLLAASWINHPNGAFSLGMRLPGLIRGIWSICGAVSFAEHAGTLPSEDD